MAWHDMHFHGEIKRVKNCIANANTNTKTNTTIYICMTSDRSQIFEIYGHILFKKNSYGQSESSLPFSDTIFTTQSVLVANDMHL